MSDQIRNPEDWFSHNEAHLSIGKVGSQICLNNAKSDHNIFLAKITNVVIEF